jgi:pimeloyl-ACP methyl ester carboxylesterase
MRPGLRRRGLGKVAAVAALIVGSIGSVLPGTASAAPEEVAAASAAPVQWGSCAPNEISNVPPEEQFRFSCADYVVPLDYRHPNRGTINLALLRRQANDQANRIGSLFINPGGPGGSGYRLPTIGQFIVQQPVLDRFDLIGFDPRGVARSTPLRCFITQEDATAVFSRMALLPLSRKEERDTNAALRDYGRFCDRFAGPLLEHMSTQDVARDLDVLRAAVGDKQLNYLGFSYGTLIGATYVNMFPKNSRAVILDGNVDPDLRLHNGLDYDLQRAGGFEISLDAVLTRCDAVGLACAFSDGNPRAKFDELRDHMRNVGPITLPSGFAMDIATFTNLVTGALYDPSVLADLTALFQALWDVIHPSTTAQIAPSVATQAFDALQKVKGLGKLDIRPNFGLDTPYTADDSYPAVNCTDKPFNNRPSQTPQIADRYERKAPTFGRFLAWADPAICPNWPLEDRRVFDGPWNRKTPNPVLVYGNFYDPATQYEFARRMARELGNGFLVSADAFGHTILGFSKCTDTIATNYLTALRLPGPGTVCPPDVQPFPSIPTLRGSGGDRS